MKKGFALFFFVCCITAMYAERMSLSEAESVAGEFFGTESLSVCLLSDDYCVVQREDKQGFVLISLADGCKRRIVAYSNECRWDEDKMPPAVLQWIEQIKTSRSAEVKATVPARAARADMKALERETVAPLLTCHWHQQSPYNDLAPVITDGNIKTVAGCVAIAAAQIVYYWRRDNLPATLKDTPTYIYGGAPVTEVIPRGTLNHWELIKDRYDTGDTPESRAAVAQLCYVIGTTSYLNYANSTGGHINDAANAIYSQYRILSSYTSKNKYNVEDWEELLYEEVAKRYPVMCGGGGHAYVLDGYDSSTNLFHLNFGWGGEGDGYYPVDDSYNSMGGYSSSLSIVYDIHPQKRNMEAEMQCSRNKEEMSKIDISATVVNNSTLQIKNLCIYVTLEGETLDDTDLYSWIGDGVNNDGEEKKISATVINDQSDECLTIYLTDERKNVLAQQSFDPSGIESISGTIGEEMGRIYNIYGQEVPRIQNAGIYIIDNGINRKKIYKR